MKCSKCHKEATKKIQLEGGFLPCCDSYDCNLLLRFELLKPQINNAMKSLIIILALLTINCNVANDKSDPCDMLVTQEVVKGGIQKYLVCGTVNSSSTECQEKTITGQATMNTDGSLSISGEIVFIPKGVKLKLRFDETSFDVLNCNGIYTLIIK